MQDIPVLELRQISKTYGGVVALNKVDFSVKAGEIHALVGENGAGKSTLINIVSGVIQPCEGEIYLDGVKEVLKNPRDSLAKGIRTIHQQFDLPGELSVTDAILLGEESRFTKAGIINHARMREEAKRIGDRIGLHIDVRAKVDTIGVANQQLVAIAHALGRRAKVLLMDEPTSSLSSVEIVHLHKQINALKESGMAVVYITHMFEELFGFADRITVIRDGKNAGGGNTSELSTAEIVRMMTGKKEAEAKPRSKIKQSLPLLSVSHLCVPGRVADVSFDVRPGEVLGIYGAKGSGKSTLGSTIYCGNTRGSGEVLIDGRKTIIRRPGQALKAGLAYLPADRKGEGVILNLSVLENSSLSIIQNYSTKGLTRWAALKNVAQHFVKRLSIKTPSLSQPLWALSGGNQQKVAMAKCLATRCNIFIFVEPQSGIDVGAKSEIADTVLDLAREGKAVVVVSSALEDIMPICNRILVMRQGQIVGDFNESDFTKETLLASAIG